jgi:putative membrane protein
LVYRKNWVISRGAAIAMGIFALGFWGALYEIIEMAFAVIYGGDAGANFLGSQGDIWDAQKDMLLDILGAIFASVLFWFKFARKQEKKKFKE